MSKLDFAIAFVAALTVGCGSTTETSSPAVSDADGGAVPATDAGAIATDAGTTPTPTPTPTPAVDAGAGAPSCTTKTYANFGQAFFSAKCNSCHVSERPVLTSLAAIKANMAATKLDIVLGKMPKGARLTAQEKADVLEWLNCGAP